MTSIFSYFGRKLRVIGNVTVLALLLTLLTGVTHAQRRQRVLSPIGNDTRTRPANALIADQFPFRAVVKLKVTFPDGSPYEGTGVFIYSYVVFTAAHVVYDKGAGGKARSVEIIPGYNGGNKPFGSTTSARIEVPDEYITSGESDYDFAAIETATPLGCRSGWFGYIVPPAQYLNNILIIGYPDDFDGGETMVQSTSSATLSNKNELQYTADTSDGMSGAPILIKLGTQDKDYRVIGVHTRGGEGVNFNFGTRFLDAFLNKFKRGPEDLCRGR
jgi:V8-like Glu-specific endopeptidase